MTVFFKQHMRSGSTLFLKEDIDIFITYSQCRLSYFRQYMCCYYKVGGFLAKFTYFFLSVGSIVSNVITYALYTRFKVYLHRNKLHVVAPIICKSCVSCTKLYV